MEKTQEMLETGSYGSLISKLSIPTIITMLVMVIYNIADLFIFSYRLSDRQETRISLSSGSLNILKVISDYASGIPPFVVNLVLMVVSTFFIGMDYVNIVNFARQMGDCNQKNKKLWNKNDQCICEVLCVLDAGHVSWGGYNEMGNSKMTAGILVL